MLFTLIVELKDKPGQLIKTLEPISKLGGNVIGIVHKRDKITPLKKIPVEISLEIEESKVSRLIEMLNENGITVREYNQIRLIATTSLLLVGHIVHTDVGDTINRVDSTGFAEVVDLHISMPQLNEPSTALITISATGKDKLKKAVGLLKEVCREKGILVIEPINEEFS